jgi:hypothetical protein
MLGIRIGFLAAFLSMASGSASAAWLVGYEVYLGGLHVGTLDVRIEQGQGAYRLALDGRSRGLIEWLTGFAGRLVASGSAVDGWTLTPQSYSERVSFRGDARRVDVGFAGGTVSAIAVDPPADRDDRDPVPQEMLTSALDPLTGLIGAAQRAFVGGRCEETVPLFDGRRRLDLAFTDAGVETLKAEGLARFAGEARKCRFKVTVLAGAKKTATSWGKPEDRGRIHSAWIAPVRGGGPVAPVRIEAEGAYGWLVVHMVSVAEAS